MRKVAIDRRWLPRVNDKSEMKLVQMIQFDDNIVQNEC